MRMFCLWIAGSGVVHRFHDHGGIQEVINNSQSFAALLADKSVVARGKEIDEDEAFQITNVQEIVCTAYSFVTLLSDKIVATFGSTRFNGVDIADELVSVEHIYAYEGSFIAIRGDGRTLCWGARQCLINHMPGILYRRGIVSIHSTCKAWAAIMAAGGVVT